MLPCGPCASQSCTQVTFILLHQRSLPAPPCCPCPCPLTPHHRCPSSPQEEERQRAEEERQRKMDEEASKWMGMISLEQEGEEVAEAEQAEQIGRAHV